MRLMVATSLSGVPAPGFVPTPCVHLGDPAVQARQATSEARMVARAQLEGELRAEAGLVWEPGMCWAHTEEFFYAENRLAWQGQRVDEFSDCRQWLRERFLPLYIAAPGDCSAVPAMASLAALAEAQSLAAVATQAQQQRPRGRSAQKYRARRRQQRRSTAPGQAKALRLPLKQLGGENYLAAALDGRY